jgi:hypothetical protein
MAKFKIAHIAADVGTYGVSTGLTGGLTSLTGNQIQPRVKIGSGSEATGSILAAKGSRKFAVTDGASINDESLVVGNRYIILTVGNTDWKTVAGVDNAAVGLIFTCLAAGAGTGTAAAVGTCELVDKANGALGENEMTITCTLPSTSTFRASRINNKYVWDFSDPVNKYLVGSTATTATTPDTVAVARA